MATLHYDLEINSVGDRTSQTYYQDEQDFDSDENEESLLDQEKKRLEEQGKMAALQVNQVQESLEEKYNKLKGNFVDSIKEIGAQCQADAQAKLDDFKRVWKSLEKDDQDILNCICIPKHLSKLSLCELKELKDASINIFSERQDYLDKVERDLKEIDKIRAERIDSLIIAFNKQVRKLKYLPDQVITRIIQDECINVNMCMIENRDTVIQYVSALRAVNLEVERSMESCFLGYGDKWHELRFDLLLNLYEKEIKNVMTQDIQVLFQKFRNLLNISTNQQIDLIGKFSTLQISELSPIYLQEWCSSSLKLLSNQEEILSDFQKELKIFEDGLEENSKYLKERYKPMLQECNVESNRQGILQALLDNVIQKYRQSDKYLSGKRSIMLIPSQITRNRQIMNRISEFIELIFSLKSENQEELIKVEKNMHERLRKIKETHDVDVSWKEKLLAKDLYSLNSVMDVKKAKEKMERALQTLSEIDQARSSFYDQSINEVKKLSFEIEKFAESCMETWCHIFDVADISSEISDESATDVLYVGLKKYKYQMAEMNEFQFLGLKISEYKEKNLHKIAENEAVKARLSRANKNMNMTTENMNQESEKNIQSNLSVELEQIHNTVIQRFRHDLSKNLLEDFQEYYSKISEDFENKVSDLIQKMTHSRRKEIQNLHIQTADIKDICARRIEEIYRLNVVHENEAAIILRRLKLIQEEYIESTKKIELKCSQFIAKIQSEFLEEIRNARKTSDMEFLIQDFRLLTQEQLGKINKAILSTQKDFETGRKAMINSQSPQQHSIAWENLCEQGHYPERDIHDLDELKDIYSGRLEGAVNLVSETINQTNSEMLFHLDDLRFLDKVKRILNDVKIKIAGKIAFFLTNMSVLDRKIEEMNARFTLDNFSQLTSLIEDIRQEFLAQFSFYRCMKNQMTENDFINKFILTHEDWLIQKSASVYKTKSSLSSGTKLEEGQNANGDFKSGPSVESNKSKPSSAASKIESLSEIMVKLTEEARLSIQILSKEYYDKKTLKQIRRPTEISPDLQAFMSQIGTKLKSLEAFALRKREKNISALVCALDTFSNKLTIVIEKLFSTLTKNTLKSIKEKWTDKTSNFVNNMLDIIQQRKSLSNQLKTRLSHPQYSNELQLLDNAADKECENVKILIAGIKSEIQAQMPKIAYDYLDKLEYVTVIFTGLLNGIVFRHNIDMPVLQQVRRPRLVSELLKEKELAIESETKALEILDSDIEYNRVVERVAFSLKDTPLEYNLYRFRGKSSALHNLLYQYSDQAFRDISNEVQRRLDFLHDHFEIETEHESFWIKAWKSQIEKIKQDP